MLILTRRVSQSFLILPDQRLDHATPIGEFFEAGPIKVMVAQVSGARIKFMVDADQRLLILREELYGRGELSQSSQDRKRRREI